MKMNILGYIFLMLFMVGCKASHILGPKEGKKFILPQEKISTLSYEKINQSIFVPKCVSCHGKSGDVRLETYSDLTANKELILKAVFQEGSMPKRGKLTEEQLSYLWNWFKLGAPKWALDGSIDLPAEPLIATYDSIDKHIFQVACNDCHSPDGPGKRILLDKNSLMSSPLELIVPGNPDESGLVIALERNDSKRMPPAKEGYLALSDQAKSIIRQWIQDGAEN